MLVQRLLKTLFFLMEENNGNNQGGGTGGAASGTGTEGSNNSGNGSSGANSHGIFGNEGNAGANSGGSQGNQNAGNAGGNNGAGGEGNQGGGNGTSGGAGGGTSGNNGAQGGQSGQSVQIPENWQEVLPEEVRNFGTMGNFKTVEQLAKAYVSAQKHIGMDKLPISKNPTEHEIKDIFKRIGLPETFDKYSVTLDPNSPTDPRFVEEFKDAAFKAGVLPSHAQSILKFFETQSIKANESMRLKEQTTFNEGLKAIKDEWGEAYTENTARAKAALKEYGVSQTDIDHIKSKYGADGPILRLLAKVGSTLDEGKIRGEGGTTAGAFTPSEAKEKIAELKKSGAYFDINHPDHTDTKKEVNRLYGFAFPQSKK